MVHLVLSWRKDIIEMSKLHEEAGKRLRKRYYCLNLPAVIIPVMMTFVQVVFFAIDRGDANCLDTMVFTILNGALYLIMSILQVVLITFDIGSRSTLHVQYATKYADLVLRIDSELGDRYKGQVLITELRMLIENLNQHGPSFV